MKYRIEQIELDRFGIWVGRDNCSRPYEYSERNMRRIRRALRNIEHHEYTGLEHKTFTLFRDAPAWRRPWILEIIEVYCLLEIDWNLGGSLHERPRNRAGVSSGHFMQVGFQIHRMTGGEFRSPDGLRYETLNERQQAHYDRLCQEWGLR